MSAAKPLLSKLLYRGNRNSSHVSIVAQVRYRLTERPRHAKNSNSQCIYNCVPTPNFHVKKLRLRDADREL